MINKPPVGYRDPEFDDIEDTEAYAIAAAQLEVGGDLRALLEKKQIKKSAFAKLIGKSPAYIAKIFRGDVNFTIQSMVTLSRALGGKLYIRIVPECEPYKFVRTYPISVLANESRRSADRRGPAMSWQSSYSQQNKNYPLTSANNDSEFCCDVAA